MLLETRERPHLRFSSFCTVNERPALGMAGARWKPLHVRFRQALGKRLSEAPPGNVPKKSFLIAIMNKSRKTFAPNVRREAVATLNGTVADLPNRILRDLDKQFWILEAHINRCTM